MDKATEQRAAALRIPEDLFIVGQPFTSNELAVMASRGYLRETLPGHYLDVRHRYTSATRARIARFVAGQRLRDGEVLCRLTAGWIHGLIPAASRICISSSQYRRPVPASGALAYEFMQLQLDDTETMLSGGVLVTDPLRTLCDMACYDPLPLVVDALGRVQRLEDRYLSLERITARLLELPSCSPVQRALRLLESMQQQAA